MANTICFDDNPRGEAGEVDDVRWNWMLAPEVPAIELLASKDLPELPLCRSRLGAQLAGAIADV